MRQQRVRDLKMWWKIVMAALLAMALVACGEEPTEPGDPIDDPEVSTKEQAVEYYQQSGKADVRKGPRRDFCELLGWYGDGICDSFCPEPDPDCAPPQTACGTIAGSDLRRGRVLRPRRGSVPGGRRRWYLRFDPSGLHVVV